MSLLKEELQIKLKPLRKKLKDLNQEKLTCDQIAEYIKVRVKISLKSEAANIMTLTI